MPIHHKILIPFDFSDDSRQALKKALALSFRFESELLILTVIERSSDQVNSKLMDVPKDAERLLKKKLEEETHTLVSWADHSQVRFQPLVRKRKRCGRNIAHR